ncbi:MAG: DUF4856 domain-containing protein [Paracoccaceae bacterium]|nr:DUF4856 domain-containing protein [Paracoccaceae bacterium]
MKKSKTGVGVAGAFVALLSPLALANAAYSGTTYGPFPVTVKNYSGSSTNSVSYTGQIARHVLHDSLKKLASKGDGGGNAASLEAEMMAYFGGSDKNKAIVASADTGDFNIKQETLNEISKGKNLLGKSYKGVVNGWPGQMTGAEVLESMIKHAALTKGGFDPSTGFNYPQLISKFAMGAVFYNQAVDNYLDEKLGADTKPNNKPYKDGKHYTGKEHVWDEAFGYWGAAAHSLNLSAKENYEVAKKKNLAAADANGDGMIDLKSEMTFAHAYYASSFDKGGKTNYMSTVTHAFVDGRQLITDAAGEALSDDERAQLVAYADVIGTNWEKVIAEAVFKYAGSVYKDINKLGELIEANGDTAKAFATYCKHWGELKGFSMALQAGKNNLGETALKMNRLIGFGPVLMNASQVTGMDSQGNFVKDEASSWGDYQLHMLKTQKLMSDAFGITAKANDQTGNMAALADKLGDANSAEND